MIEDFQLTPLEPLKLKISSFTKEFAFLSNFYPVKIFFEGICYPTLEHGYQASKFFEQSKKLSLLQECKFPGQAKRWSRRFLCRADWLEVRNDVMLDLLRLKFPHPASPKQSDEQRKLSQQLIDTGDAELIEANTWGDRYWGVYRSYGENMLGKMLMQIRDEFDCELDEEGVAY